MMKKDVINFSSLLDTALCHIGLVIIRIRTFQSFHRMKKKLAKKIKKRFGFYTVVSCPPDSEAYASGVFLETTLKLIYVITITD